MAVIYDRSAQIITMGAAESFTAQDTVGAAVRSSTVTIDCLILTATAAGAFVLSIDGAAVTINISANELTKVLPISRTVHIIGLTSGPVGAALVVVLRQK
jgi:hypothetical protein